MDASLALQTALKQTDHRYTEELNQLACLYFKRNTPKILLVEDDLVNQKITELFLIDIGCTVDIVDNGELALATDLKLYNGVVLDIGLPGIDGLEVARAIRAAKQPYADIPILVLTAHMQAYQKPMCMAVGVNEFLLKPSTVDELRCMLYLALLTKDSTLS